MQADISRIFFIHYPYGLGGIVDERDRNRT